MRLNARALAAAGALLWASAVLFVGLANLVYPPYGREFLSLVSSLYPGYGASRTLTDVMTASLYALVDGALAGLVLGWLYNRFAAFFSGSNQEKRIERKSVPDG